jgi:hypothetical protein
LKVLQHILPLISSISNGWILEIHLRFWMTNDRSWGKFEVLVVPLTVVGSVFPVNFHLPSMWHQWNKKCNTFVQILDGIIIYWWKFSQMDEKWSNWIKTWR